MYTNDDGWCVKYLEGNSGYYRLMPIHPLHIVLHEDYFAENVEVQFKIVNHLTHPDLYFQISSKEHHAIILHIDALGKKTNAIGCGILVFILLIIYLFIISSEKRFF